MHILLTDVLTCPRCGPDFGLIVLADGLDDRRIREGRLGCANCRASYPIAAGIADLRHPVADAIVALPAGGAAPERAFRAAALVGVQTADHSVLILEPDGALATGVANVLPNVHVLGLVAAEPAEPPPADAGSANILSRLRAGTKLPFRSASIHGVAALDVQIAPLLAEIRRVMVQGARLVVDPSVPDSPEALQAAGFTVLLEQEGVVVAAAQDHG